MKIFDTEEQESSSCTSSIRQQAVLSMSGLILAQGGNLVQDVSCHPAFKAATCFTDAVIRSKKEHA